MTFADSLKKKTNRVLLATLAVALVLTAPRAQQPTQSPEDRIALYQALLDLTNPWTVMCVAAHPDDEDGTSLIVMRRKYGAHTVSLFSTFGEGGQNAIGPELYEELGAIRARETMAAAEIQGSEPHFLGLKDFGYSKTRDEAFKFWGHEEGLRRMVLEIRKLRPDAIITNHSTTSNDHGQHQATALMLVEAFDAAADPKRFPEQLKDGVTTWQVQRLFVRARGNAASAPDAQIVTIDPNEKDPVRGVVYAAEALRALQQHATQGPWPKSFAEYANRFRAFSGQPGGTPGQLPMIRYALVREAKSAAPLSVKDSHNFLDGLRLPDSVAQLLSPPLLDGKPLTESVDKSNGILQPLIRLAYEEESSELRNEPRVLAMKDRLFRAMGAASGITISINPKDDALVPGKSTDFTIVISNKGSLAPRLERLDFNRDWHRDPQRDIRRGLRPGETVTEIRQIDTPENAKISVPHAQHLYDGLLYYATFTAKAYFKTNDSLPFVVAASRALDVAPVVEIAKTNPNPFVTCAACEGSRRDAGLTLLLRNHRESGFRGELMVATNNGSDQMRLNLNPHGSESMRITADRLLSNFTPKGLQAHSIKLSVTNSPSAIATETVPLIVVDAQVARNLNIGYVRGFDFSLPNALNALGVESKELSVDEVKTSDLSKFTSIIVDNRVYESQPELIGVNQKLLEYAQAGGNLIVFYHKSDEWNPDPRRGRPQLAPYKLILGNERITDENAPITFIEPAHPLLNVPNKLNQDDFKDWIQERGLYYPKEWDPQFHALLQSSDPGENPLKGGLLVADYGRGHYIYTSMVWYRELRGGVPGAYRMLANMISYGRERISHR